MGQQHKIMIVDDDADIVLSLQQIFTKEKFEVTTAENGLKCIEHLQQGFQGIIILDIMMPLLDGIDTIKKMVVEGFLEGNTIIVLTVKKIQGEEFDDIYEYIYEFIQKPFDVENLVKTVKKAATQ